MDNTLYGISVRKIKNFSFLIFSSIWCFGFLLGCIAGLSAEPSFYSLMHWTFSSSKSIFGLLIILCLPYLLTGFAVLYKIPRFLFVIAFLKAFLFGFSCVLLKICFGEEHWGYQFLVLFTDFISLLILVVLWLLTLHGFGRGRQIVAGLSLCFGIGLFDFIFISPFIASMIENW